MKNTQQENNGSEMKFNGKTLTIQGYLEVGENTKKLGIKRLIAVVGPRGAHGLYSEKENGASWIHWIGGNRFENGKAVS